MFMRLFVSAQVNLRLTVFVCPLQSEFRIRFIRLSLLLIKMSSVVWLVRQFVAVVLVWLLQELLRDWGIWSIRLLVILNGVKLKLFRAGVISWRHYPIDQVAAISVLA